MRFEIKYTRTPKIVREFFISNLLNPVTIAAYVCAVILAAVIYLGNRNAATGIILTVLLFFSAVYSVIKYGVINVNKFIKSDREQNGGELLMIQLSVSEESIVQTSNIKEITVNFSEIIRYIKTKNLIILAAPGKKAFIIPKSAFTLGSAEDFILLLKKRGLSYLPKQR